MNRIRMLQVAFVATLALATGLSLSRPALATMPALSGHLPAPVAQAFQEGLFSLPERTPGLATSTQSFWRIPIIMVEFPDSSLTHQASEFEQQIFDSTHATATGSVFDYYRWVSGGRLTITGRVVATVRVPEPRAHYGGNAWGFNKNNTPGNAYGLVRDALDACREDSVDWSEFDMDHDGYVDILWVVHAGIGGEASADRADLWSFTSGMSYGWRNGGAYVTNDPVPGSTTQTMRVDRFTILPELSVFSPGSISEIGVFCHEFGHALGLPDLYDTSGLTGELDNVGPGNWSLMSSGAYGGDGHSPQHPTHLGAWPLHFLGWDQSLRPAQDTTLSLEPIERHGSIIDWWFQGEQSAEHFLIEDRRREGFDQTLLEEGLLITHVDESVINRRLATNQINVGPEPGLRVVEADGNYDLVLGHNHGDAGDPFPGATDRTFMDDDTQPSTHTFSGAVTNLAIRDIMLAGDGVSFSLQVRAPGWLPAEDFTDGPFQPFDPSGLARTSAVDEAGQGYVVDNELVAGHPQVILRSGLSSWGPSFQVTASPTAALDPALGLLPGGHPVIVWSENRTGRSELYFRSRIGGVWTPERRLLSLPGDCRNPAIGVDGQGNVDLAFRYVHDATTQIGFMRFTYFSPFGQPTMITSGANRPQSPAIAVGTNGVAYVIWPDQSTVPQRLWYSTYRPDFGLSVPEAMTSVPQNAQLAVSPVVDPQGDLHVVWEASGPGINELHYQHRSPSGSTSPLDTLIESQSELIQDPELAVDSDGSLHLVFEAWRSGNAQVRYKRYQVGRGWDARSTDVTPAGAGVVERPLPLPTGGGNLSVVYVGYSGAQPRFMVRRRQLTSEPLTVAALPPLRQTGLVLGPNPLRAGQALRLRWSGPARGVPPAIDFYDLSGRRVAEVGLEAQGDVYVGRLPADLSRRWPPGIYFARVRVTGARGQPLVVIH